MKENIWNDLYFKDVFTKTEHGIDMSANQLNINCITSNQNKFHLDSEGNLTVNSITTAQKDTSSTDIYDLIYPVGSIYMSVNDVNPATLFGGTWESLKNKFLLGAGDLYEGMSVGGNIEHDHQAGSLAACYLPKNSYSNILFKTKKMDLAWTLTGYIPETRTHYDGGGISDQGIDVVGTTEKSNHMPPYLAVYMWKRVA